MNCDVFDTYVTRPDGQMMHFDIIVPSGTEHETALAYGQHYLVGAGIENGKVTAEQCRFCHVEQATPQMAQAIAEQGYFILAMEGCPPAAAPNKNGGLS